MGDTYHVNVHFDLSCKTFTTILIIWILTINQYRDFKVLAHLGQESHSLPAGIGGMLPKGTEPGDNKSHLTEGDATSNSLICQKFAAHSFLERVH